jgi:hypothetical protein
VRRLALTAIAFVWAAALPVGAAVFNESFAVDPRATGWRAAGETNLFRWNANNQNLEVTWNSARTNSFFDLPLRTVLTKSDDFSLAFELRMQDIAIGTSTNRPDTFEITLGFMNSTNLTRVNYFRGTGVNSTYGVRNSVEFNYFPPTAVIEPTFAPTVISSNNVIKFSDNRLVLTTNDLFHIAMTYTASNQTLKTAVMRNGVSFGNPPSNTLMNLSLVGHPDFRVDRLAIINYSDALQTGPTQYWGSILAHGTVDNFIVTVPDAPVRNLTGSKSNATWRATFTSLTNWFYSLERSTDLATWNSASATNNGTGSSLQLQDLNAPIAGAFYRISARRQ